MGEKSPLEKNKKIFQKSIDFYLQCGIMIIEKERNSQSEQGKRK